MTKFLIDQQLPRALATHLTGLGHDAKHIKDYPGGATLEDAEVTRIADAEGRIIVTKDDDFRVTHLLQKAPQRLLHVTCGTRDPSTGRSIYDPPEVFSSPEVLAAEDRLLAAADDTTAPTGTGDTVEHAITAPLPGGRLLGPDQADAIRTISASGGTVDVLVGPAGTGKTTTLTGLRAACETQHGPGSVVGLVTSSAAAHVLSTEVTIAAENTAQQLAHHHAVAAQLTGVHRLRGARVQPRLHRRHIGRRI